VVHEDPGCAGAGELGPRDLSRQLRRILQLQAQILWPRGLRLIGRLVELAFLNPREANREVKRLKVVVEGEAAR
jgi:hypothetical protein